MRSIDKKKTADLLDAFKRNDTLLIIELIKAHTPKMKKNSKTGKQEWSFPTPVPAMIDINAASPLTGITMVMHAIKNRAHAQLKMLLSLKAFKDWFTPYNRYKEDKDKSTVLHYCARYDGAEILPLLASKSSPPVNDLNKLGFAPLHIAALRGDMKVAEILMAMQRVKVNVRSRIGSTPLMLAASNGHQDMVNYLLSKGANPDLYDQIGRTYADYAKDNFQSDITG